MKKQDMERQDVNLQPSTEAVRPLGEATRMALIQVIYMYDALNLQLNPARKIEDIVANVFDVLRQSVESIHSKREDKQTTVEAVESRKNPRYSTPFQNPFDKFGNYVAEEIRGISAANQHSHQENDLDVDEAIAAIFATYFADEAMERELVAEVNALVRDVLYYSVAIDAAVTRHLSPKWRLDRISVVLRSILRVLAYEIMHRRIDLSYKSKFIREFLGLAKAFAHAKDTSFVHLMIDRLFTDVSRETSMRVEVVKTEEQTVGGAAVEEAIEIAAIDLPKN